MIDLFDLKKGEAKYYDKPQRFYVVRNNNNVPRITIKETYAVWRRKTQNKVWFQSKYEKGTRSFDFSYTIDQLANSIPDALIMSKLFKIERSQENVDKFRKQADFLEEKLKDPNNFTASIDEDYLRKWGSNSVKFEKLVI
ncbi:MAG: hypothetical protein CBC24_05945 [Candidatus Pelagibacter sp. TMED64]|nr:hypothetical protein [Candidatus Pelagibacter sp.]OUU65091.1 MAG: hypothetical protein CBC24_05945 [Candidatus Pelagibacter sp. TMED64]|tara:strand:- start:28 stop:447 length:420 start_codon:yes stop_codon:yes gene_type:complete